MDGSRHNDDSSTRVGFTHSHEHLLRPRVLHRGGGGGFGGWTPKRCGGWGGAYTLTSGYIWGLGRTQATAEKGKEVGVEFKKNEVIQKHTVGVTTLKAHTPFGLNPYSPLKESQKKKKGPASF